MEHNIVLQNSLEVCSQSARKRWLFLLASSLLLVWVCPRNHSQTVARAGLSAFRSFLWLSGSFSLQTRLWNPELCPSHPAGISAHPGTLTMCLFTRQWKSMRLWKDTLFKVMALFGNLQEAWLSQENILALWQFSFIWFFSEESPGLVQW